MTIYKDWRDDLVHFLTTAGTQGRTQTAIVVKFKTRASTKVIQAHLEALQAEDKVQLFLIPIAEGSRGQKARTWRATTKIWEE